MQIDFHHTVSYVVAREAGFGHEDASQIAYAAQYVDDAVNSHPVRFDDGEMFARICSAHEMLDYRNFKELANHLVWIPFHFLPGNTNEQGHPAERFVCKPDSEVAREMVRACIRDADAQYALMRLGVTLHVYADTWAHQEFAGINHPHNDIRDIRHESNATRPWFQKICTYFGDCFDKATGQFVGDALPLGHGAALSYPDLPYLSWSYQDAYGHRHTRNNTLEFLHAADMMCRAARAFRTRDAQFEKTEGLSDSALALIRMNFEKFTEEDGNSRHENWLRSLREDFGYEVVPQYIHKGPNSWQFQALGRAVASTPQGPEFHMWDGFYRSSWKLFHDALAAHQYDVLRRILPQFGILAA